MMQGVWALMIAFNITSAAPPSADAQALYGQLKQIVDASEEPFHNREACIAAGRGLYQYMLVRMKEYGDNHQSDTAFTGKLAVGCRQINK
ncbi:MAG TPA: hypothetical protein VHD37_00385 [Candidatus Paceibacterota bacterium]|nr:hypothetical protein [Candidatus Paceibacterota bacterium]